MCGTFKGPVAIAEGKGSKLKRLRSKPFGTVCEVSHQGLRCQDMRHDAVTGDTVLSYHAIPCFPEKLASAGRSVRVLFSSFSLNALKPTEAQPRTHSGPT